MDHPDQPGRALSTPGTRGDDVLVGVPEHMTIRSGTTAERQADSRQGSGGPGQAGLGYSVNVSLVPHRPEDSNLRSVETIKKPTKGATYFIDVLFDAPDGHIRLNHNCE